MFKRLGSKTLVSVLLLGGSVALADGPVYGPVVAPHAPCSSCPSGPSYPWMPGAPTTVMPGTTTPGTTTPGTTTPGTTTPGATTPGATTPGTNPAQPGAQDQNAANNQNTANNDANFNQAPGAGTSDSGSSHPQMMGDQLSNRFGRVGDGFITVRTTIPGIGTIFPATTRTDYTPFKVPIISHGAFKIAENESPAPEDRAFVNFQFYNNIPEVLGSTSSSVTIPGAGPGTGTFASPAATNLSVHELSVYRETLGFEKSILDGNASVGLRVPLIQTHQALGASLAPGVAAAAPGAFVSSVSDGLDGEQIGDLSFIFKYALYKDCSCGNVISTGVVVTVPTGQDAIATDNGSNIDPVLIQPFVGWLYGSDNWYVQGFTSIVAPTDLRDVVEIFNDFGVGYQIYRCSGDELLTAITPTAEIHINTPLTHRGTYSPYVYALDAVDFTGGVHFDFGKTRLTVGASTPLTGPKPYEIEAIAQLNVRF